MSSTAAGNSGGAAFSGDGRFLVFVSEADDHVTHCDNGPVTDVFLRDLLLGQTELISVSLDGLDGGNRSSRAPAISSDGRWIVFESAATNLVEGDENDVMDVFLHDRTTGRNRRISSRPDASPVAESGSGDSRNPVVTPDGQWVFFDSGDALVEGDLNGRRDVFRYRVDGGGLDRVSIAPEGEAPGDADSSRPIVDPTGRWVAFHRLHVAPLGRVPPEGTDLMIRDLATGSVGYLGSAVAGNVNTYQFSGNGRSIAASLFAGSRGDVVVWKDLESGATALLGSGPADSGRRGLKSIAMTGDGLGLVMVWSTWAGFGNVRIPTNSIWTWTPGEEPRRFPPGPDVATHRFSSSAFALSPDGGMIAFRLDAVPPGVDGEPLVAGAVYARRLEGGPLLHVADDATSPLFHPAGTQVLVETGDSTLVPGDRNDAVDLVLRDLATGTVNPVSVAVDRAEPKTPDANLGSDPCLITADGRKVFFVSYSDGLVPGDTNRSSDIFMRDLTTGALELISVAMDGARPGNQGSFQPAITPDGRWVAFLSLATNLVPGAPQEMAEVYLRDRELGITRRISEGTDLPVERAAMNPAISADGRRVLFEIPQGSRGSKAFVWQLDPGGLPVLIPVQGVRGGIAVERACPCCLSADGTRVGFLASSPGATFVLDLTRDRYLEISYPMPTSIPSDHGIAINSTGSEFITLTRYETGTPVGVVWHSDTGASRSIEVHLPSDEGWNLEAVREVSFSADDRFIVFTRWMNSANPAQPSRRSDVFLHDLYTKATTLISANRHGSGPGNGFSRGPSVSSGGRRVAFLSDADDLVAEDTNGQRDVFVRDVERGVTRRVSSPGMGRRPVHGPSLAAAADRIAVIAMDPAPRSIPQPGAGSVLVASLVSPDTDGDGLDDDWERSFFDSLQGGPDDDPDADGITSLQELIAGTLPDSAGSTLRLRLRIGESGASRVEWDSVFGRRYELVRIPGGANGTPQVIGAVDGTGSSVAYEDLPVPGETAALYRVRVHRSWQ